MTLAISNFNLNATQMHQHNVMVLQDFLVAAMRPLPWQKECGSLMVSQATMGMQVSLSSLRLYPSWHFAHVESERDVHATAVQWLMATQAWHVVVPLGP